MHWKHCILEAAEDKRLYLKFKLIRRIRGTRMFFHEIEHERDFVCLIGINDGCGGELGGE